MKEDTERGMQQREREREREGEGGYFVPYQRVLSNSGGAMCGGGGSLASPRMNVVPWIHTSLVLRFLFSFLKVDFSL